MVVVVVGLLVVSDTPRFHSCVDIYICQLNHSWIAVGSQWLNC